MAALPHREGPRSCARRRGDHAPLRGRSAKDVRGVAARAHALTLGVLAALLVLTGCQTPPAEPEAPIAAQPRGPAPIKVSPDPWVLATDTPGGDYRGGYLGNGYLGQRVLQIGPDDVEPSYLAGFYEAESLVTL